MFSNAQREAKLDVPSDDSLGGFCTDSKENRKVICQSFGINNM